MDLKELAHHEGDQRHPWELSRAAFFRSQVLKRVSAPVQVMDIGCGDAWFAGQLAVTLPAGSQIHCIDKAFTPELKSRLQPSRQKIPVHLHESLPAHVSADLILLLDVLEHIEDDSAFLKNILDHHLKAGGLVVVSVPAYPFLFSEHDKWLGHFRRYSPMALRRLLQDAGLEILDEGGLFFSLLFVRLLQKGGKPSGVGAWKHGRFVTGLIEALLNLDWRIMKIKKAFGCSLPGLSRWCICRKV